MFKKDKEISVFSFHCKLNKTFDVISFKIYIG